MLENVKSSGIIKLLFSYLDDKKLLTLIKYNKKFQNLLEINIKNYKIISGKCIIIEKDGAGKEYNPLNGKVIFEGQYLNGKRNGKGKEYNYNSGFLIFEGEYLNGKRYGKGKDYNDDSLLFEGEYLNGQRHGKGKEYFLDGNLKFEGEYLNGKKWTGKGYGKDRNIEYEINNGKGNIKEYFSHNSYHLKYEGEYLNGERNGKGKEYYYYLSMLMFEGEYLNGKKWNGNFIFENNNYEKEYYELKEGKGYIKTNIFEGEYLNGERNGKGKIYDDGNLIFLGEFLNGEKNGKGKDYSKYDNNILLFDGEYRNGKRHGECKEYYNEVFKDNLQFEGEYKMVIKKRENFIFYIINWNLKENIYMIENGMEKDMI